MFDRPSPGGDLRSYLEAMDSRALVDLVLERAAADEIFDAQLRLDAARDTGSLPQVAVFRRLLDDAFAMHDFVGYREMYSYTSNISTSLDSLQDLLDHGHADAVMTLAEYAIDLADDAVQYVDDSDGRMSIIVERLEELHLAACAAVQPDPVTLARTLLDREQTSGNLEAFHGAAKTYAEILGNDGIAEYRRLAEAEWEALPPLGPDSAESRWSSQRFRITSIMETLAQLTGDVDAVVEVLARDQASSYQFVRIAQALRDAQRDGDALIWAEKGLALYGHADSRLVEVAAEAYQATGRSEDAIRVTWIAYNEAPNLDTYRTLASHAQRADAWPVWHDKALALLRTRISRSRSKTPSPPTYVRLPPRPGPDGIRSTLVEVLLFDGDVEGAWSEANANDCRVDLWLELARRREGEHPLEAIPIWQSEVERRIDARNNQGYSRAVELIVHIGKLMIQADRDADFLPYVTMLREAHNPKRNLMKLFNARGWLS